MDDDVLFQVSIDDKLDELLGELEDFAADQLPYAKAAALFGVGLDAREEMTRQLHKRFTIRTGKKPWASRAMVVYPDKVSKLKERIVSGQDASIMVTTRDDMGSLLSEGGTKTHKGRKSHGEMKSGEYGVPSIGGGRKSPMIVIRPGRNSPADLLKKKGVIVETRAGKRLMLLRTSKAKPGGDNRLGIKAMFYMRTSVQIKPWWDLRRIRATAMTKWLPTRFEEAARHAMATRKS